MKLQNLPPILPVYAEAGTILLPRSQLPLVLQGEEEKALVEYALQEGNRLIGVIQPTLEGGHFQMGCVGRIIHFQEGAQFFIILGGLCRFKVKEVLEDRPIKKVLVNYQGYEKDLQTYSLDPLVNRPHLLSLLKGYLEVKDIDANWEEIEHASNDRILSSLTMACPFEPIEKQALLETPTLSERCDMMIALMEMAHPHLKTRSTILH
jgi:Lon protease-like protein